MIWLGVSWLHGKRRSGRTGIRQDHPFPRTSVARPVCYQRCCHDHHEHDHGGSGVFAAGHLGELTQIVPFELADAVLADARAVQRRLRLPSTGRPATRSSS